MHCRRWRAIEMKHLLRSTALFAALALAGCVSVGPNYKTPATPTPQLQGLDAARESSAQFQAQWWKQFGDPTLDALIQRIAVARLAESRALLGGAKSQYLPDIQAGASYTRSREQTPGFGPQRNTVTAYQAGFDASWEIDVFGGVRRSVEAAHADLGASEAALADAQVSLFAEVARNYFDLRGTQQRQDIARRDIANQQDTLKL